MVIVNEFLALELQLRHARFPLFRTCLAARHRARQAVRRLGFMPASTLDDALEIATDVVGRSPTITHLHTPPIVMSDVR